MCFEDIVAMGDKFNIGKRPSPISEGFAYPSYYFPSIHPGDEKSQSFIPVESILIVLLL